MPDAPGYLLVGLIAINAHQHTITLLETCRCCETGTWHGVKLGVPRPASKKTPSDGKKPRLISTYGSFPKWSYCPTSSKLYN